VLPRYSLLKALMTAVYKMYVSHGTDLMKNHKPFSKEKIHRCFKKTVIHELHNSRPLPPRTEGPSRADSMSRYSHSLWNALTWTNPLQNSNPDLIIFAQRQVRSEIVHSMFQVLDNIQRVKPRLNKRILTNLIEHKCEDSVVLLCFSQNVFIKAVERRNVNVHVVVHHGKLKVTSRLRNVSPVLLPPWGTVQASPQ
jgi:hypothetical protein